MPQISVVHGLLVGTDVYEYEPFTGSKGETVPGGVSRHVFIATDVDSEPSRIKVREDDYVKVMHAGFCGAVTMRCEPFAKNNRVIYECTGVDDVKPAKAA